MDFILTAKDLSIGYFENNTPKIVASKINLSFKKGNLIALIGSNGIGKSTLLRTLSGIQRPINGAVFLNGKEIGLFSKLDLAQNLSLVLTEKLPPSNLTAFELIALGRQPYTNWIGKLTTDDLQHINQAIALTNIDHLRDKKHFEISDGQLQIALIARALAQDTPLIILDEPTTHLDLLHKVSLLKLLKKLSQETNKCILFSSHDVDLAIQLADEMVVMTNNNIVQNSPCKLIAAGIFDALFVDANIVFDRKIGKFVVTN